METALVLVAMAREYLEAARVGFLEGDTERGHAYGSIGVSTLETALRLSASLSP